MVRINLVKFQDQEIMKIKEPLVLKEVKLEPQKDLV